MALAQGSNGLMFEVNSRWPDMQHLMQDGIAIQERRRQGILGIHMKSLDEHVDKQELEKLLGEVIHQTRASSDSPAPDHRVLAKVILSRQVSE